MFAIIDASHLVMPRIETLFRLDDPAVVSEAERHSAPVFLTELEPRGRAFRSSVAALFRGTEGRDAQRNAEFWPDVFVNRRLPWTSFVQSAVLHGGAIALVWLVSLAWVKQHSLTPRAAFDPSSVTYYSQEEYLRPLDTGQGQIEPQKGEPEFSRQTILSVPPEPDNRTQTIVAPPDIKLAQDVPLPNVVSWPQTLQSVPISATSPGSTLPALPIPVVAPPPDVNPSMVRRTLAALAENIIGPSPDASGMANMRPIRAPQAAVVEPAPAVDSANTRQYGDLNIARAEVVAPAPALPVSEQRAATGRMTGALGDGTSGVVPPPPSVSGNGTSSAGSRLIALGVHPATPTGPVEPPAGNRRGRFAATPAGRVGAVGTPDIAGRESDKTASLGSGGGRGQGTNGKTASGVPPGLHVGTAPDPDATSTIASTGSAGAMNSASSAPGASSRPTSNATHGKTATPLPDDKVTDVDRQVFGVRRVYSMTLNMPNLNSAGGSWVIRFSELSESAEKSALIAPEATHKVDPGYPIELIRQNVHGTVMLRAVIREDGRVSEVKVLSSPDDRLDQYAQAAFARWQFLPGMKNGSAVPLEAVVSIPFRIRSPF
jgi:TonB family protein